VKERLEERRNGRKKGVREREGKKVKEYIIFYILTGK
jgi:hypothetical protein